MELLETQDPEKKKLIEASERHKRELEKEIHEMSDKTEQAVKNALIIGGTLAAVYLAVRLASGTKKKREKIKGENLVNEEEDDQEVYASAKKSYTPSFLSQVGERLAAQATAMVLQVAKDKLAEYISKRNEQK